jgi:hypothetical protein
MLNDGLRDMEFVNESDVERNVFWALFFVLSALTTEDFEEERALVDPSIPLGESSPKFRTNMADVSDLS